MSVITKDLGAVTAYAAAVNRGYTGTKEEFETLMASYATVAQQAARSATSAGQSATDASQSATDAETAKGTAQAAASSAQTFKSAAEGFAQSAQQSAQSASQSAQTAESAKNTAVSTVDEFDSHAQQALDSVNQAGNNWKSLARAKALDSEAYALGTRDGEDVGSSDPAYHNNAKYYAESAGTDATTASDAAQTATAKASDAQASAEAAAESARTLTIDATLTQSGQAADSKVVGSILTPLERKYRTWNIDLTSDSYATEITDIYVNTGDILDIEVTQQSNANIAVYGDSHTTVISTVGDIVFTAQATGYIRFYYKSVHCKIKFRNNVIVSELGNSTELIASQKLVNNLATDIDNLAADIDDATGYKSARLTTGCYFIGSTVGGTVKKSAATNNWDYSATPLFVKSGKIVHCTTRANGMCCIAKSQSATWTDNEPIAVAIANDNVNAKEYTVSALEDAYYWFSGRAGETTAYIENNDSDEIIVVDINGGGNYTSLTACLTALKNNTKEKTIYIKEGTYDIFSELGGAEYIASITNPGSKNWRDVQPVVPRNTKIIGQGNVKLTFLPEGTVIGSNEMAFLFSPLNIDSDCEVENIAIECTNCRYALHIESSSIADYNDSILKFKNVRCKKTKGTYGTQYVCGTGIGARQKWYFDSCSFEGDIDTCWSVHINNAVANDMAVVIMNNCVFVCTANNPEGKNTIRFVSSNNQAVIQNIAKLNNCYTNGKVFLENNNTRQQWDVTLLNCKYAGVGQSTQIVDNPYPIKEY